jgi:hypothetical protein
MLDAIETLRFDGRDQQAAAQEDGRRIAVKCV